MINLTCMKKHNGMRPQDIVIILKIFALGKKSWYNADLARSLKISPSEITEALNRCRIAGLIDSKKKNVNHNAVFEFIVYGLRYVFPAEPGAMVRGTPTAHSAPPIKDHISSKDIFVWPYMKGSARGQAIEPLYRTLPEVVSEDRLLYELLVITDTFRVGRIRERNIAIEELKRRIKNVKSKC